VKTLEQINQEFIESCIPTESETKPLEPLDENDQWLQDLFNEVNSDFEFQDEESDYSDFAYDDHADNLFYPMAYATETAPDMADAQMAYVAEPIMAYTPDAQPVAAQGAAFDFEQPVAVPAAVDVFQDMAETPVQTVAAQEAAFEFEQPVAVPAAVDEHPDMTDALIAPVVAPDIAETLAQPVKQEEMIPAQQDGLQKQKAKKVSSTKLLSDIIFYAVIAFILVATLLYSGRTNNGFQLFGYSGFTVLTRSMQSEIPQGALVITKEVDPETIKVGDDITFIRSDNATITHRVVAILNNYEDSGYTVFQTQGIENPDPDPDYVYAGNIIGIVKYSMPELGFFLSYVAENIGFVFIILGGILVAAIALGKVFTGSKNDKKKAKVSVA